MNRFDNIDCMQGMAEYEDNHFDLCICDPPYGIDWMKQIQNPNEGKNWKKYKEKSWDKESPSEEYFEELKRVSKNQIIWGANYYENMPPTPCWIIWDKMQEFTGAVFEMAWTSFNTPAKAFRMSRVEAYTHQLKIHPTQKPIALYKWLLTKYAKEGDKILDTHVGSASSLIACEDMGFNYVAFEIDKDYYDAAQKRLKQFRSQLKIDFKEVCKECRE